MNYQTDRPIYLQVIDDIRKRLIRRELTPGQKLPSVRELAINYKINPNTASRVYREMELLGLCYTKRGTGTFITEEEEVMNNIRTEMASEYLEEFLQGMEQMGFSLEEMIELLKERKKQEEKSC